MTLEIGIMLAFACAAITQLGFLLKHRGVNTCAKVDVRHPLRTAINLWSSKWFAIGMSTAAIAFVLHVAAMWFAPLSVVQAVLSSGVVIMAVLAQRFFGHTLGRRQWAGVACTAIGLILLGVTLPGGDGTHNAYSLGGMIAFEAGLLVIGMLLISGPRMGLASHHHGVMLGTAAGLMFGVSDIGIKALTGVAGDGVLAVVLSPWLAIAVLASVIAFYASARGLQDGDAVPVIAATSTAANVAAIGGGIVVFGDPLPGDTLGIVVQICAFALVIVAAALTPPPVPRAAVSVAA